MAPKKSNGFMVFCVEWKSKHGRHMSMPQATSAAGEIWAKMTPKQREPYLNRALNENKTMPKKGKLTCVGTPISMIEKEANEKQQKQEIMLKTIEKTIKLAVNGKRLPKQKFYFIMVNYFIRLLNTEIYVPAEIGIVEFCLLDGVTRKYHSFVNPNFELYGNVYEAQNHADTTHKLPLPPNAMGESNMEKISSDIMKFILDRDNGFHHPLYTTSKAMDYISSALSFIARESETDDLQNLNIYSIQELFYALKCVVSDLASINKPRNRFVSDAFLEKDTFEYASNIACDFHEEMDRSNYCALSQVHRWAFSFADYMCKDLSITFIPGHHFPGSVGSSETMENQSTQVVDQSVDEASCAMSTVSLDSNYLSCTDGNEPLIVYQNKIISRDFSAGVPKHKRISEPNINLSDEVPNSTSNIWKRRDITEPPESQFFSIDFEKDLTKSNASLSSRRGVRGRGIVILEDFK